MNTSHPKEIYQYEQQRNHSLLGGGIVALATYGVGQAVWVVVSQFQPEKSLFEPTWQKIAWSVPACAYTVFSSIKSRNGSAH